jgi:hypothetical protein
MLDLMNDLRGELFGALLLIAGERYGAVLIDR